MTRGLHRRFRTRYLDINFSLHGQTILEAKLHKFLSNVRANHLIVRIKMYLAGHSDGVELLLRCEEETHDGDGLHCVVFLVCFEFINSFCLMLPGQLSKNHC